MRVAVIAGFLKNSVASLAGNPGYEIVCCLAKQNPEVAFIFISDDQLHESHVFSQNVTIETLQPIIKNSFSSRVWHDIKLPFALNKLKVDVLISFSSNTSLTTAVPQVLLVNQLAFLQYPQFFPKAYVGSKKIMLPRMLRKTKAIVTLSAFTEQQLMEKYKLPAEKITVVSQPVNEIFRPVDWSTKEAVKEEYTQGFEYFIYYGTLYNRRNITNLLKAFSIFKKWQKSRMKLVLLGDVPPEFKKEIHKLDSYKYRADVVLLSRQPLDILQKLVASAYALVYPSLYEDFGLPLLEAMASDVAVITTQSGALPETGADAALYADATKPESIAEKMLLLYKDENLRNSLVEKGRLRVADYNRNQPAEKWMALIQQTAKK